MSKTIMILGAGQLQVPLLQRAKERGLRIIIVTPDSTQPGVPYADAIVKLDIRDEEGILAAAKEYQIDGITTDQTDMPVRTAAYVADAMGLPSIGYELGCLFTDKYKMRKKCDELDVPNQRYALTHSLDKAIERIQEIGFPAIIKPIDSQASHGVSKISTLEELKQYFADAASYSRTGHVLIEQCIEGTEFPVDSYVLDGKCHLLAIGQYHPFSLPNVFSSYETVWPSYLPKETLDLIEETNKKIVEGFGLKTGRTHAEYIVSNGKCYLIEIGARGGGSFFSSDDVRYISGISSEDFLLDFALGYPVHPEPDPSVMCGCCCTLFFYLPEFGTVTDVSGKDEVLSLPFVHRNNLDQITVGKKTLAVIDKGARQFMVVSADHYEQLQERVNMIRSKLRIQTRLSDGSVQLPIWK